VSFGVGSVNDALLAIADAGIRFDAGVGRDGGRGGSGSWSHGGLSPEQVRRVVIAHVGALRTCYELEARRDPQLRGGATAAWQIEPDGTVSSASITGTTLHNSRVEGCIVRQVKSWSFPSSDARTTVAGFPFRFGVGD
jgi:hypothetical protein